MQQLENCIRQCSHIQLWVSKDPSEIFAPGISLIHSSNCKTLRKAQATLSLLSPLPFHPHHCIHLHSIPHHHSSHHRRTDHHHHHYSPPHRSPRHPGDCRPVCQVSAGRARHWPVSSPRARFSLNRFSYQI